MRGTAGAFLDVVQYVDPPANVQALYDRVKAHKVEHVKPPLQPFPTNVAEGCHMLYLRRVTGFGSTPSCSGRIPVACWLLLRFPGSVSESDGVGVRPVITQATALLTLSKQYAGSPTCTEEHRPTGRLQPAHPREVVVMQLKATVEAEPAVCAHRFEPYSCAPS
jgi:hypothetical protein